MHIEVDSVRSLHSQNGVVFTLIAMGTTLGIIMFIVTIHFYGKRISSHFYVLHTSSKISVNLL